MSPKCKFTCPTHSEAKQQQNVRVWSRETFIEGPTRIWGPMPSKPQTPWKLSPKTFSRKAEGGAGELLQNSQGSDPLFLKWGQSSGNDVPVNLHQMNVILCSDNKGPKSWLSFSEVQSWLREGRAQLVAPSGPGPQTLSSCHGQGSQVPRTNCPPGSSGCPNGRGQVHRLHPMQTATAMRSQRQRWGRGSPLSEGLGPASRWPCEGSRALQDGTPGLFPGPSNLPAALRLGELQVPREEARICLYLTLPLHGGLHHGGPPLTPWTACWMPPWGRERLPTPVFCIVRGVAKSRTQLSDFHFHSHFH